MKPKASKPVNTSDVTACAGSSLASDGGDVIDMGEAIALLKTTRPTFYRWLRGGKFRGMKMGRQWRFYRSDIEAFLRGEGPRIALLAPVVPFVQALEDVYASLDDTPLVPAGGTELERAAYLTVAIAMRMDASDIHIQPGWENEAVIRLRVDGVLHEIVRFDRRLLGGFVEQWKTLSGVDLAPHAGADGRVLLTVGGVSVDLRSSFVQSATGDCATMRLLWKVKEDDFRFDSLRISLEARDRLAKSLAERTGLIVVTGPTGSGKTTTLYSAINHVASPTIKVMTAEDPVEMLLKDTVQIPVRPDIGMTFGTILTRIFRSDPDVIMVGEIRDRETLEICCKGAAVGHLMLTSLHTATAVETLYRMAAMLGNTGLTVFGGLVRLILAQRLLRRACPHCVTPGPVPSAVLAELRERGIRGGLDWDALPKQFAVAPGCRRCGNTGYRGRIGVAEALVITPAILHAFRAGAEAVEIQRLAVKEGMIAIDAQGLRLAAAGETTLEEVLRVFHGA